MGKRGKSACQKNQTLGYPIAGRTLNASRLKARLLLGPLCRRFPALFPPDHKNLRHWAIGESARLRQVLAEDGGTVSSRIWHLAIRKWFHGDPRRRVTIGTVTCRERSALR